MNYSELTDFEINKLVAEKLGYTVQDWPTEEESEGEIACVDSSGVAGIFEPCNNPSDAWPIILENKINIGTIDGSVWWTSLDYNEYGDQNYCEDKNPLRAAMEVYLMMGDE